jgi:hypothetical protein
MLEIDDVRSVRRLGEEEMSARVRMDDHESRLWFKWNGAECPLPGDAFLLATIQPAMRRGYDLQIRHAISEDLLDTLFEMQQHFQQLDPDLTMIDIRAHQVSQDLPQKPADQIQMVHKGEQQSATGVLFDGSVDAFYTFHKNQHEINTVIYLSDYEGEKEVQQKKNAAIKTAKHRTKDLGMPFVHVQSNLRHFLKTFNNDQELDQVLVIAVIDTLLSGHVGKLLVPGTGADEQQVSQHPPRRELPLLFDSYLPTSRIQLDQDGAGVEHLDKLESLKDNHTILEALRVCWENPDRAYNCGRCKKCTRRVSASRLVELLSRDSRLQQKRFSYSFQETRGSFST